MSSNGNDNGNGTNKLVYWILGALLMVIGMLSGFAHNSIMHQLDSMESRMGRIETILLNR